MRATLLLAVMLAPAVACRDRAAPAVCTESFAMIPLTVRDQNGASVQGLSITATILRTETSFTVPQGSAPAGSYTAYDDNFRDRIRTSGDSVRIDGYGGRQFSTGFRIDVPGGCHVRKLAGPDTVTAQ
jgi:hypothetical protein